MDTSSRSKGSKKHWTLLWHGRDRFKPGIVKLLWVILRLILSNWLWGTAVRLAHFQLPTKTIGVVLALVSVLLIIWAFWGFWQVLLILGIKRLGIAILVAFCLFVVINVLTVPDVDPIGTRIYTQVGVSVRLVGKTLSEWTKSIIRAPNEFSFACSGQRKPPPLPPGFPTPDPRATPVQVIAEGSDSLAVRIPTPQTASTAFVSVEATQAVAGETTTSIQLGSYVQIVNTGGQPLRARTGPGTSYEIVSRFPAGMRLLIIDGPVSGDDFIWWKVRSEDGVEGWCAARWLAPIDE